MANDWNGENDMGPVSIDNEWLSAVLPDGFVSVPHAELEAFMRFRYDCMWGVRDDARHMLICITWKDSNKLLTRLVSEKSWAKQVDETFSKRYRADNYRCQGFFTRNVRGASGGAWGFRFSYMTDGVAQDGEVLTFKRGIRCYTLCYYSQSDRAGENRPAYEAILTSLEVH